MRRVNVGSGVEREHVMAECGLADLDTWLYAITYHVSSFTTNHKSTHEIS
jgi:hypothetical protein